MDDITTKMAGMYVATSGRINANFTRRMKDLSSSEQQQVWEQIKLLGLDEIRAAQKKEKKKKETLVTVTHVDQSHNTIAAMVEHKRPTAVDIVLKEKQSPQEQPQESFPENSEEEEPHKRAYHRSLIRWTDAEWDRLADIVHTMRRNYPVPAIGTLTDRAMQQFPEDRRRNLTSNQIKPLLERLKKLDEEYSKGIEAWKRFSAQGKTYTREGVLDDLSDEEVHVFFGDKLHSLYTDEEIQKYFKNRVLQNLGENEVQQFKDRILENCSPDELIGDCDPEDLLDLIPTPEIIAYLAKKFSEHFGEILAFATMLGKEKKPHSPTPKPSIPIPIPTAKPTNSNGNGNPNIAPVKKKVRGTVLGAKPNQQRIISNKLKDLPVEISWIDKNNKHANDLPENQDFILMMSNFSKHSCQDNARKQARQSNCEFIIHKGGITTTTERLRQAVETRLETTNHS